jgi:hypothetical protein
VRRCSTAARSTPWLATSSAAASPRHCQRAGPRPGRPVQRQFDRGLAHRDLVGQAHAVGAEHAGQRVHEDPAHAQRVGHAAGMLAAGAAEALQRVLRDVVAPRHRDALDGIGHVLDGDLQEAFGQATRRGGAAGGLLHLRGQRVKRCATPSRSSASSAAGRTPGNHAGWILPSSTLASVVASGPPRR